MNDSRKKTVVLTGAAGQIGREYVYELEDDVSFILIDSNVRAIDSLKTTLKNPSEHSYYCSDFKNIEERSNCFAAIMEAHEHIDVLINCAAYTGDTQKKGWISEFGTQSIETWRDALEVNLTACFELCQSLAPKLRLSEDGNILNIGSIYGSLGPNMSLYEGTEMGNPAAYAASKGGLAQITRWLATVLAPEIRVNCISPGGIYRNQPDSFVKAYTDKVPLGRMGSEKDVVATMKFFTLGQSQYITGQNLFVDGGFSIW